MTERIIILYRLYKRVIMDFLMAATIFLAAVIEPISWVMANKMGREYLEFWFPLLATIQIWFFAAFFFIRIFRYNACIYTQLVSIIFFIIQSYNIAAYGIQFGLPFYNHYIFPFFLISISLITVTKLLRCFTNH